MYFEINVALNGKHFFATAAKSCTSRDETLEVYKVLKKKFPEEEGYSLEITRWEEIGYFVTKELEEDLRQEEKKTNKKEVSKTETKSDHDTKEEEEK